MKLPTPTPAATVDYKKMCVSKMLYFIRNIKKKEKNDKN